MKAYMDAVYQLLAIMQPNVLAVTLTECIVALGLALGVLFLLCSLRLRGYLRKARTQFSEDAMSNDKLLREPWTAYSRGFIKGDGDGWKTTDLAGMFFTEATVIQPVLKMRWWMLTPHLLVLLSVFALLAGMSAGLVNFSVGNPDAIMESAQRFFRYASVSLAPFLIGLVLALVLSVFFRAQLAGIRKSLAKLTRFLDDRFRITPIEERRLIEENYTRIVEQAAGKLLTVSTGDGAKNTADLLQQILQTVEAQRKDLQALAARLPSGGKA